MIDASPVSGPALAGRRAAYAIGAIALLVPLRLTSIPLKDFTNAVAMTLAVLGVNLMAGFVGRVALGHGAFVGIGAYASVILSSDHGWSPLAAVPVAALLGFGFGLLVGLPALRIRGLHLALVTLGVGAAFGPFVKRLGSLTNGPNGKLSNASWDAPSWFGDGRDANARWIYVTVVAVALLVFVLARNITSGRIGRSLVALRDGEVAALASGVDVRRCSIAMFGCSAAVAAIAGALLMLQTPYDGLGFRAPAVPLAVRGGDGGRPRQHPRRGHRWCVPGWRSVGRNQVRCPVGHDHHLRRRPDRVGHALPDRCQRIVQPALRPRVVATLTFGVAGPWAIGSSGPTGAPLAMGRMRS